MPIKTKRKLELEFTEDQLKDVNPEKLYESKFIRIESSEEKDTDWERFAEKLGLSAGFLSDPKATDVVFVDENGNFVENKAEALTRLRKETMYFFTENNDGPYELMCDENENIWINPRPLTVKEILGEAYPKEARKAAESSMQDVPDDLYDDGKVQQLKAEQSIDDDIARIEKKLTKEKLDFARKPIIEPKLQKLSEDSITAPKETFGRHDFYLNSEAPANPPEDSLPPEPTELTKVQKFWDGFVKYFNGKGSRKGQAYRRQQQERTNERERYTQWRDGFNQRVAQYKVEEAELKQNIQRQNEAYKEQYDRDMEVYRSQIAEQNKILADPYFQKYVELGMKKARGKFNVVDPVKREIREKGERHGKMRELMEKNRLAAITDMQKNGFTVDNIGVYQKYMADELKQKGVRFHIPEGAEDDPTKQPYLNADEQRMIAKYLLVKKLNKDINEELDSIKKGYVPGATPDLRSAEMQMKAFRDPKENERMLKGFMEGDLFKDTLKNLRNSTVDRRTMQYKGSGTIEIANLTDAYNDAEANQARNIFARNERELRDKLTKPMSSEKREDIMVKIGILAKRREEYEMNTYGAKPSEKVKNAIVSVGIIDWDYSQKKQRFNELNDSFKYYYDIQLVPKEKKQDFLEYVGIKRFLNDYDDVKAKLDKITNKLNNGAQGKDKVKNTAEIFGKLGISEKPAEEPPKPEYEEEPLQNKMNSNAKRITWDDLKKTDANDKSGFTQEELEKMQKEKLSLEKKFDDRAKLNKSDWEELKAKAEKVREENNEFKKKAAKGMSLGK